MNEETLIEKAIAKFPKAKRRAVENFAGGSEGTGMTVAHAMNLEADRQCYGWNAHTVSAIKFAINGK